jgi:hypothetical protein
MCRNGVRVASRQRRASHTPVSSGVRAGWRVPCASAPRPTRRRLGAGRRDRARTTNRRGIGLAPVGAGGPTPGSPRRRRAGEARKAQDGWRRCSLRAVGTSYRFHTAAPGAGPRGPPTDPLRLAGLCGRCRGARFVRSDGAEGTRTPGLRAASASLSQLSYSPRSGLIVVVGIKSAFAESAHASGRRLTPELFQAVVLAGVRGEDVGHHVQVVQEDPAGFAVALGSAR